MHAGDEFKLSVKVDLYEHGLQTATRTLHDNADEETVVYALSLSRSLSLSRALSLSLSLSLALSPPLPTSLHTRSPHAKILLIILFVYA